MIRFFAAALLVFLVACIRQDNREIVKMRPSDHLYWQRAYPDTKFDVQGWQKEFEVIRKSHQNKRSAGTWQLQGPANTGARINTIAVHPDNHQIMLIGYSAGGMYKTTDGGVSWKPVFDQFSVLAIGDIVFDQADPRTVYVGTGDPNISGIPFVGQGIYRSTDTGETWSYLGLEEAGIIAEIILDPSDPQIIYAASMGVPFYRDANRGLYKSLNGGLTWTKILYIGDGTGVIDLAINPLDSRIIYAAAWDRIRNYEESTTTGSGARIHKSMDGGHSWTVLSGGLPNQQHSRIGIELSPSNPERLYAVYVNTNHDLEEVFTTTNAGITWTIVPTTDGSGMGTQPLAGFGWYFGKIRVNPQDEEDLYLLGVRLWRYNGRTKRWIRADQFTADVVHPDKHDLWFVNSDTLLLATDGGLYRSSDDAKSWIDIEDIPTTQFYRVAYNPHLPEMFYGGAQDIGSVSGNGAGLTEWTQYYGGDGFRTIFHPDNAKIYYVETQSGGLFVTTDGGQSYEPATKGIDRNDLINWDAPVIMSQHNPDVLYYGTDRVYRNKTGPDENFSPISPRLTDEVILLDATSNVSALAESPFNGDIIFAGTGDGNLHRTEDDGRTWIKSDQGLPDRYITSITMSPEVDSILYVTHSGFKSGEKISHVHRSEDLGRTWSNISGDLPSLPVNDLLVLTNNDDKVLFVATDAGVYFTRDAGVRWLRLGSNMPMIPVFDLEYHPVKNLLIAGTHAKSIHTFDLDQESLRGDIRTSTTITHFESLEITPNPVSGLLRFSSELDLSKKYQILIHDMSGRRVIQSTLYEHFLDVSNILPGSYQVSLSAGKEVWVGRFIKH